MGKQSLLFYLRLAVYISLSFCAMWLSDGFINKDIVKDTLSILQNISAAVFTLSGLWIAIIYPEAIKSYTSKNISLVKGSANTKRVEHLIIAVSSSAFVLLSILIFTLFKPIIIQTDWYKGFSNLGESIFTFYLFFIIFIQIAALIQIIVNGLHFALDLYRKAADTEKNNDM